MSLQERIEHHPPFSALPLWRRIVLICCLGFFVLVAAMTLDLELDLYGADPDHPVATTGHVYPVGVAWGYIRYATSEEHDKLYFWKRQMGDWIGVPALAGVFLWFLYRPKK